MNSLADSVLHITTYTHMYINVYVCVCVYVCIKKEIDIAAQVLFFFHENINNSITTFFHYPFQICFKSELS